MMRNAKPSTKITRSMLLNHAAMGNEPYLMISEGDVFFMRPRAEMPRRMIDLLLSPNKTISPKTSLTSMLKFIEKRPWDISAIVKMKNIHLCRNCGRGMKRLTKTIEHSERYLGIKGTKYKLRFFKQHSATNDTYHVIAFIVSQAPNNYLLSWCRISPTVKSPLPL